VALTGKGLGTPGLDFRTADLTVLDELLESAVLHGGYCKSASVLRFDCVFELKLQTRASCLFVALTVRRNCGKRAQILNVRCVGITEEGFKVVLLLRNWITCLKLWIIKSES